VTFRRALFVANPIAGRGRGERVAREVVEGLRARGIEGELYLTRARGDATQRVQALDPALDLIVSVGGDGTLREIFAGLDGERVPVAIVPLGTANVLSLDLKLPRDVAGAIGVIERGRSTAIDVAFVNGELSFLVTGVGLDALVVREVERARRGPITKLAYVSALRRALREYRVPRLEVELDGVREPGPVGALLISNVIHYGCSFHLASERVLDDGLFEVYLFRDARPLSMARAALRGLLASWPGGTCEMRRARRVRVGSDQPVAYHVDGDFRGETPIQLEVSPVRRRILIP
jgi:YegS/Rv2252/BmrU family lipid kinase